MLPLWGVAKDLGPPDLACFRLNDFNVNMCLRRSAGTASLNYSCPTNAPDTSIARRDSIFGPFHSTGRARFVQCSVCCNIQP